MSGGAGGDVTGKGLVKPMFCSSGDSPKSAWSTGRTALFGVNPLNTIGCGGLVLDRGERITVYRQTGLIRPAAISRSSSDWICSKN